MLSPSSVARALAAGTQNIERVDKLVPIIAATNGQRMVTVDETVQCVERWLANNRAAAI